MINLKLNQTLIYNFNRDGFIILEKFIERNFIKSLRERFKPLFNGKFEFDTFLYLYSGVQKRSENTKICCFQKHH